MINQFSPGTRRLLGRAGVLVGAAVWLLLSGVPASHADGDGLLQDTVHIVGTTAEQVVEPVEPVVQPVQSAVQQPVEQAVAQTVEPAVGAAEQPVEAVVRVVEQPVEPVVKAVEPAVHRAGESGVQVVEPAPAPAAPQAQITGGPNGSHTGDVSHQNGARHVDAGAKGPTHEQRQSETAGRTYRTDLAPRATGRPGILRHSGSGDDRAEDQAEDQALWALTNALMHMWAGEPAPGTVNAGLPGGVTSAPTPWMTPLVLGLLLGFLSLVLARRRLG